MGGGLTTSIFLPEVVGFMLPIDVYSHFDPFGPHTPAVMRSGVVERMVSKVMVGTLLDNLIFMAVVVLAK